MAFTASLKVPGAGTLDQRVELHDLASTSQDAYGQPTSGDTTTIGTFWASIRLTTATEKMAAQQAMLVATHRVVMRWLGSAIPATPATPTTPANPHGLILPGMYLVVVQDGTRLDILDADNYRKAKAFWVLTCQERKVL